MGPWGGPGGFVEKAQEARDPEKGGHGFRVWVFLGLFRVSGFRVEGLGFQGLGFQGLGFQGFRD